MKKVKVFSKSYCPFCIRAIELLKEKDIEFEVVDITEDEEKMTILSHRTNCDTVPQIFIDENFIGGCDELMALASSRELDEMLRF